MARSRPADSVAGPAKADVPLDGVTEIRVHGVGGATPEALLGDPHPVQVAGDATAGFYRTSDRGGRHIEAYSWGGLTSRSGSRVFWLLLLPFMMANMAGWTAISVTTRKSAAADPSAPSRLYVWTARLAALATTLNVMLLITLAALDVIAFQCGGDPQCSDQFLLAPLRWVGGPEYPGRLLVIGSAIPAIALGLMALLSYKSRKKYESITPPGIATTSPASVDIPAEPAEPASRRLTATSTAALLPRGMRNPDFWSGAHSHMRLSRMHTAVAMVLVAAVMAWCASQAAGGDRVNAGSLLWCVLIGSVVVTGAVIVLLGIDDKRNGPSSVLVLIAAAVIVTAAVVFCWIQPRETEPTDGALPGMRLAFNIVWGLFFALLVPLLAWLPMAWRRRRRAQVAVDPVFRWSAPLVVNLFGLVLTNMVLVGLLILVAQTLGDGIRWEYVSPPAEPGGPVYLPPIMQWAISVLCFGLLGIFLVVGLFALGSWLRAGSDKKVYEQEKRFAAQYEDFPAAAEHVEPRSPAAWQAKIAPEPGRPPNTPLAPESLAWMRGVLRWRALATWTPRVSYLLSAVVFTALPLAAVIGLVFAATGITPGPFATSLGVTLAVAIPPVLLGFARSSYKDISKRRIIGTVWDVGTFFPRSFHPFAPPSYAERAVPDLLRRIWRLHDSGGRVVLAAHSQGSVLAAAALARENPRPGAEPQVGLVTFGSPLVKLYRWCFPSYFSRELLTELANRKTGIGARWKNLYYATDYIGGPTAVAQVDEELRDPPTSGYIYGQPIPRVGSHTGYWTDPYFWEAVDRFVKCLKAHWAHRAKSPSADSVEGDPGCATEPHPPPRPGVHNLAHDPVRPRGSG